MCYPVRTPLSQQAAALAAITRSARWYKVGFVLPATARQWAHMVYHRGHPAAVDAWARRADGRIHLYRDRPGDLSGCLAGTTDVVQAAVSGRPFVSREAAVLAGRAAALMPLERSPAGDA